MIFAYSEKYNYSIGWNGKCGCSMFRKLFVFLHKDELEEQGMNLMKNVHQVQSYFPENPNINPFQFICRKQIILCRNPYKRAVSMFTDKICGTYNTLLPKVPIETITFRNFIYGLKKLKNNNRLDKDSHIIPQISNFKKSDYTTIIKLEEFDEKITKVYTDFGLFRLVPKITEYLETFNKRNFKINKTKRNNEDVFVCDKEYHPGTIHEFPEYYCFYDEELYEIVYDLYKEDFENFGYKKYEI